MFFWIRITCPIGLDMVTTFIHTGLKALKLFEVSIFFFNEIKSSSKATAFMGVKLWRWQMLVMSSHCPPCQLEPLWRDVSVVCQRKLLGLGWVWVVNSSSLSQKSQNPIKIKRWSNMMYHIHNICTSPFRSKKTSSSIYKKPTNTKHTQVPLRSLAPLISNDFPTSRR